MEKVRIVHFHNGMPGGVLTVIRNLLANKQNECIENHIIYAIDEAKGNKFEKLNLKGANTETIFFYSLKWNFYYTCKKLAKCIPDQNAIIVAHDWLELGMVSNLGLQNPVVHVLHGDYDYYYDLAFKCEHCIDEFIAVSPSIKTAIINKYGFKFHKINTLSFPVDKFVFEQKKYNIIDCIFFVNDLSDPNKNFNILPDLDEMLKNNDVSIRWHIAGGGILLSDFIQKWKYYDQTRIKYYGWQDHSEIVKLLKEVNLMLLPSMKEGYPISVVEAMKNGVVPIVNNWNDGLDSLIVNGYTGFKIPFFNLSEVLEVIKKLSIDEKYFSSLSSMAKKTADELFDPNINTRNYEDIFLKTYNLSRNRLPSKIYGSRLDNIFIPNFITKYFRKLKLSN